MYQISEIFYSIQGEGVWSGTPCLFLRFYSCNRNCEFCDTYRPAISLVNMELKEIAHVLSSLSPSCSHLVLTGGEPFFQPKFPDLCAYMLRAGYNLHIETNGDLLPPQCFESDKIWITVSPKDRIPIPKYVKEVKWLVGDGKELWRGAIITPPPCVHFLQPVWDARREVYERNLATCIHLVKKHPTIFRLNTQQHKEWGVL